MTPTCLVVGLAVLMALPPHPLNQAIGGRSGNSKPRRGDAVVSAIVDSRAFAQMVDSAVRFAKDPVAARDAELASLSPGGRVRVLLADLFAEIDSVKQRQESLSGPPGIDDGRPPFGGAAEAGHPLDSLFAKYAGDASRLTRALRGSQSFRRLISRAATEARPLRETAGLNYAEQVRVAISEALRQSAGAEGNFPRPPQPPPDVDSPPPAAPP